MAADGEWVVWFNGKIVPEREALVPFRDRGFKFGDAVFDTTRTFAHKAFRTSRPMQLLIALWATSATQKGVLWWAGHHRHHHRHRVRAG